MAYHKVGVELLSRLRLQRVNELDVSGEQIILIII